MVVSVAMASSVAAQQQACPTLDTVGSLLADCGVSGDNAVATLAAAANGPVKLHVFPASSQRVVG